MEEIHRLFLIFAVALPAATPNALHVCGKSLPSLHFSAILRNCIARGTFDLPPLQ